MTDALKPCPFCGGPVQLELARVTDDRMYGDKNGERRWYGVVCRNTTNVGGSCCMDQVPSASKEAATARWNMRAPQEKARRTLELLAHAVKRIDEGYSGPADILDDPLMIEARALVQAAQKSDPPVPGNTSR